MTFTFPTPRPQLILIAVALALGCTDAPAPTPSDATVRDVVDAADGADVGAEADTTVDVAPDRPMVIPRCDIPDGGVSAQTLNLGRNMTFGLCNFCHQDAAPGAGMFSGQTTPRPMTMAYGANLTPDRETGIGNRTNEQIARAIRYGIAADGRRSLCEMAPFGTEQVDDATVCAIIAFLRSLEPVRRPIPPSTCTP